MNEEYKNIEQTSVQKTPEEEASTTTQSQEAAPTVQQGEVLTTPQKEIPATPQEEIPSTLQGDAPEENAFGPLVGVVIIIIVLIAGGIYFWSTTVDREELPVSPSTIEADEIINQLNSQGTSDEITDIEADLNTTELDNLDSELDDLLNEL